MLSFLTYSLCSRHAKHWPLSFLVSTQGVGAQSTEGGRRVERAHGLRCPMGRWVFSRLLWGAIDTFKGRSIFSLALALGCVGWRGRPIGDVNRSEEMSDVRTWVQGA